MRIRIKYLPICSYCLYFFLSSAFCPLIISYVYYLQLLSFVFLVGNSVPTGEEDISPYATFHLLGMREEAAKNGQAGGMNNPANFQTMPHPPQQNVGTMHSNATMMGQGQAPQTPRHSSQTMNVRQ